MKHMNASKIILFFILLFPVSALAYSPAARFNVVPYQRIEYGSSFKVGVVAFSKPGVASVAFSVTDNAQGYSGGTKTATEMTYNDRSDTYEYWVTFPASEFTGNGAIEIAALVTDDESNTRSLTLDMIVEGASAFTPQTCYVATTGNDSTCTIDDSEAPCLTVAGCEAKLDDTGADISGDIIYVQAGSYSIAGSATTSTEWLTISAAPGVNNDDVIFNSGSPFSTSYLKLDGVTLQSNGGSDYRATSSSTRLWTNNCRKIGSGRWVTNSNPVFFSDWDNHFSTNDYTYNVDYGHRRVALVRGATLSTIGNDAFENAVFIVNSTVDDVSNGALTWHSDFIQAFTGTTLDPPANRIFYNLKATSIHYEAVFWRSDTGIATDNAFVNIFIEMREPCDANEVPQYVFTPMQFGNAVGWDHMLIWNCTLIGGHSEMNGTWTNSSFVGNVFYQFWNTSSSLSEPNIPRFENGNSYGNEALYNHFEYAYGVTSSCDPNCKFTEAGWACPRPYTKVPDSGSSATATTGGGELDQLYTSDTFGYPVESSELIDRFTPKVPIDINNDPRDELSDVGAFEVQSEFSALVRSAGYPIGAIDYTLTTTIGLTTSENATCKWDDTADTAYADMNGGTFDGGGTTTHSDSVSVLEGTNTFYVRCTNGVTPNDTDYTISFTVEEEGYTEPTATFFFDGTGSTSIGGGTGSLTIQ